MGHLIDLSEEYKNRVAFLFIYIHDTSHADPAGIWDAGESPGVNRPEPDPGNLLRLVAAYGIPFHVLLDRNEEVERQYDAGPKRLVVIGADGRIVHDGGRGKTGGPSDWDLEDVEDHIRAALAASPSGGR